MKWLTLIIYTGILASCSNVILDLNYYNLHAPHKQRLKEQSTKTIVLTEVKIANYLQQASLVMQIKPNQYYYSPQDLWAEPLVYAFDKTLLQKLNRVSSYRFIDKTSPLANNTSASISVELQHLHSNDQSMVITAGNYFLTNNTGLPKASQTHHKYIPFYFELPLEKEGYGHAVLKMQHLVELIATQITKDLDSLVKMTDD